MQSQEEDQLAFLNEIGEKFNFQGDKILRWENC